MPCPVIPRMTIQPERQRADGDQAAEADEAAALPGPGHVGAAEDGVAHDPRDRVAGLVGRACRDASGEGPNRRADS